MINIKYILLIDTNLPFKMNRRLTKLLVFKINSSYKQKRMLAQLALIDFQKS